jgi:hypothetical protein
VRRFNVPEVGWAGEKNFDKADGILLVWLNYSPEVSAWNLH